MDKWIKENKITAILALALVVFFAFIDFDRQSAKTTFSGTTETSLALQAKCADRAASFFKQGGYEDASGVWTNSYINHWNNRLGKCFIQITGLSVKRIRVFIYRYL